MSICGLDGIARVSEASVYRVANVTPGEADEAMRVLLSPDPKSKDPTNGGRRIKKVSGGYQLLNYFKYRQIKTPDQKASYMRDYMKGYRKKNPSRKPKWKEAWAREADEAIQKPIPMEIPPEVEHALSDFLTYRHALAAKSERKMDAVRLTPAMVDKLFDVTRAALVSNNPAKVAAKLNASLLSAYRAPDFQSLYA